MGRIKAQKSFKRVVILKDMWCDSHETFSLLSKTEDSIVKDVFKTLERNRKQKQASWREVLIVIPLDSAKATQLPLSWNDFEEEVKDATGDSCTNMKIWSTTAPVVDGEHQTIDCHINRLLQDMSTSARLYSKIPFLIIGAELQPLD